MKLKTEITLMFLLSAFCLMAQNDSTSITFNGQLTAWGVVQIERDVPFQIGGRFVPTLLGKFNLDSKSKLDFEASLNINGSANFTGFRNDSAMGQLKPYRVWARYSGQNWEIRTGLQKINFGPAKLFRPLMWFDGVDVRDPLQLTSGVYAALGRYYFPNNANLWLWTLIGNKAPKGFEINGTSQWKPEIGGRLQLPAGPGELAFSTNYRKADTHHLQAGEPDHTLLNELKAGLDGKWDLGIGLWFESSITFSEHNTLDIPAVQDAWNLGMDYTFPIGNGLGMTLEYFRYHRGDQFLVNGTTLNVAGSLFTYPLSVLDNLSAMVFYIPGPNLTYNYLSWTRTYDNWSLYAIGYWNPSSFQLITSRSADRNMFAGKGVQLMVNYNF